MELNTNKPKKRGETVFSKFKRVLIGNSLHNPRVVPAKGVHNQYGGDRNINEACGYPDRIDTEDYFATYSRNAIAKRVVEAYPSYTWLLEPKVFDSHETKDTPFTTAYNAFAKSSHLYSHLERADILCGIGRFGILLVGVDDAQPLETPIGKARRVTFLQAYAENRVVVKQYDEDPSSPRYGMPLMYTITISQLPDSTSTGRNTPGVVSQRDVHYSRVVHMADNTLDSTVFGYPRMESVYNNLMNIIKLSAGSSEMFWRGGYPGYVFSVQKDARIGASDKDAIDAEAYQLANHLSRQILVDGLDVDVLQSTVADPMPQFNMQLSEIAAATQIPQRILIGSERGKLASTQDSVNWYNRAEARRRSFGEGNILRPLIDMLMAIGVLPKVTDYFVEWPEYETASQQDKAEVFGKICLGLYQLFAAPGAIDIIPPHYLLVDHLGITEERAKAYLASYKKPVQQEPPVLEK